MTTNKDLKRKVRARMVKTGEAYTTARAHLVARLDSDPSAGQAASGGGSARDPAGKAVANGADERPMPENYLELAGMSDEAVAAKTGRTWPEWVRVLDTIGASELPHREIARWLEEELGTYWWPQAVAVGYERIRGLREVGQQRSGEFDANRSKTFAVPIERLFQVFADDEVRDKWLGTAATVSTATPHKSLRMRLEDGSPVNVYLTSKSPTKASVQVQQRKLRSKEAVTEARAAWSERFERLEALLG